MQTRSARSSRLESHAHAQMAGPSTAKSPPPERGSASAVRPSRSSKPTQAKSSAKAAKPRKRKSKALPKTRDPSHAHFQELYIRAHTINWIKKKKFRSSQLDMLNMVFYEITPYPPNSWIGVLAVIVHANYEAVNIWFGNTRQRLAKNRGEDEDTLMSQMVCVSCPAGNLRMRPIALRSTKPEDWTDSWFEEVCMIWNFRLQVRRRAAMAEDSGSASGSGQW
ncbi:hypothetical protein PLICRDRAFT_404522 [Plicaturopsis crispa FD-325 SS-3]|nr:hypothetical protein PLICRDRAFT_404522 [Plicaturopsis crispa FD-325 SS-3]